MEGVAYQMRWALEYGADYGVPIGTVRGVGGGFIGLEVAGTARALGLAVQVIEVAPRLLARSVSAAAATSPKRTRSADEVMLPSASRNERGSASARKEV